MKKSSHVQCQLKNDTFLNSWKINTGSLYAVNAMGKYTVLKKSFGIATNSKKSLHLPLLNGCWVIIFIMILLRRVYSHLFDCKLYSQIFFKNFKLLDDLLFCEVCCSSYNIFFITQETSFTERIIFLCFPLAHIKNTTEETA